MKKITSVLVIIFLLSTLLFAVSCNNTSENKSQGNEISQGTSETENGANTGTQENKTNENSTGGQEPSKTPEANNNDSQSSENNANDGDSSSQQQEPNIKKYYVDKQNYLIKPLDSSDDNKLVLLTFDDAPQGYVTTDILDILDKHQAKAIFFVNGIYAVKHPDLLKEIYNRGHIIGNHTWQHENLSKISKELTKEEIVKVDDLVEELTGERPQFFRPPFGVMTDDAKEVVKSENMQRMNWSLGSRDWDFVKLEQVEQVIDQVVNNITPGANILMHDKRVTAAALDKILTELTNKGYTFVVPTEVIAE